jgi:hypothetical protein
MHIALGLLRFVFLALLAFFVVYVILLIRRRMDQ